MAVSKSTRRAPSSTRQHILTLLHKGTIMEERKLAWIQATAHHEAEPSAILRFPVYGHLHALNCHAQSLVEVLSKIGASLDINSERTLDYQYLVELLRASVTGDILDGMAGIEHTEAWIFESLRKDQEKKLRDPDDVYIDVRQREAERVRMGHPPQIRFLAETPQARDLRSPESDRKLSQKTSKTKDKTGGVPNG
jgi:hypothetical protein